MARVFVSHASFDGKLADLVLRELSQLGHEVFLARNVREGIRPGDDWRERLHRELRAADAVVCVLTEAYLRSSWCAYEIGIGHEVGSLLLPLYADPAVSSPLLENKQGVVLAAGTRWAGDLDVALRLVDASKSRGWRNGRSPFPGLEALGQDMAQVFFGRSDELRRLARRLRSLSDRRLQLVVGGSGCGKSSLVRAGLAAQLGSDPTWLIVEPFVPGRDPVRRLAQALESAARRANIPQDQDRSSNGGPHHEGDQHRNGDTEREWGWEWDADRLHGRLRAEPGALTTLAHRLLDAASAGTATESRRLLIIVDQGEELFTRTPAEDRSRFAAAVAGGLDGPIRVVIAMRSEFQDQLFALPELHDAHVHAFPLRPLGRDMLRVVITEPARVAGLSVDEELVSQMVDDTEDGEALPLLAFTLHELAHGEPRGGRLSARRYEELGGVRGALARRAEAVLGDAVATTGLSRETLLAEMAELATIGEAGRRTRRRVDLAALRSDAVRTAFGIFIEERLLSTPSDSLLSSQLVGVVHEALLTAWQPLDSAIREREAALLAEGQVERAAARYEHDRGPLWDVDRLTAATTTLWGSYDRFGRGAEPVVNLNQSGRRFLAECHRQAESVARRNRWRRRGIVALLSVLLATAVWQNWSARQAQQDTEQARRAALAQSLLITAANVRATDRDRALRLGIAAAAMAPAPSRSQAETNLLQTLAADPTSFASLATPIFALDFAANGKLLAVGGGDKSVSLWFVERNQLHEAGPRLRELRDFTESVQFSGDSRQLTATTADHTTMTWDVADPASPRALGPPRQGAPPVDRYRAEAPTDGIRVAGGAALGQSSRNKIRVTDDNGNVLAQADSQAGDVTAVALAPRGQILATIDAGPTVQLWDTSALVRGSGALRSAPLPLIGEPLTGHSQAVRAIAFAPGGDLLASGGYDGTIRLWRLTAVRAFRSHGIIPFACDTAPGGLDPSSWQHYLPGVPYQTTCR